MPNRIGAAFPSANFLATLPCRDPLAVLRAAENGDTQVVAIFTDYTPDTLRRIAALMEANKIEAAELF